MSITRRKPNEIILSNWDIIIETYKIITCDIDIKKIFYNKAKYARQRRFYLDNTEYKAPYTSGVLINEINKWYHYYTSLGLSKEELISTIYLCALELMNEFSYKRVRTKDKRNRVRIVGGRPRSYLINKLPLRVKKELRKNEPPKPIDIPTNIEIYDNNLMDKIIDMKSDKRQYDIFISLLEGSTIKEIKEHFHITQKELDYIINNIKEIISNDYRNYDK